MTDTKLLALLNDFYTANKNVVLSMLWAIEEFEKGRDDVSLAYLFEWCEAKDARAEIWKRLQNHYPEALMLKEGIFHDRDH